MNNQRDRRFRKSFDNEHVNRFMTQKLHMTQEQVDFKSNSISPGTQFMIDLSAHIDFFIKRKIHEDSEWRNLEIVFSDGNVPGEGEHKIMDYIRSKAPTQSLRETHCIYGNDSDLVLLGLKLHLPNIFILREPNVFVDQDRKTNYATKRFQTKQGLEVLFINLLREYLFLEFMEEEFLTKFKQKFDGEWGSFGDDLEKNKRTANAERFIDDFVLLTCLVGNDFLPSLYGLSTKHGDLDLLIRELKTFYEDQGKFLVFREEIHFDNLLVLLQQIQGYQNKFIECCSGIFKREIGSYDRRKKMLSKNNTQKEEGVILGNEEDTDTDLFLLRYKGDYDQLRETHAKIKKMINLKNQMEKRKMFYYLNYFREGTPIDDEKQCSETVREMCRNYFQGMEFKHKYYTTGCPSWVWYYRYSLCPLLPDLVDFLRNHLKNQTSNTGFPLVSGTPFRPFVQLLHILPGKSLGLLPPIFKQTLFNAHNDGNHDPPLPEEQINVSLFSFIGDKPTQTDLKGGSLHRLQQNFPENFKVKAVDNIRSYTWHPMVDKIRGEDMAKLILTIDWDQLTPDDKLRNSFRISKLYQYDEHGSLNVKSTLPGFEDTHIPVKIQEFDFEKVLGKSARKMDRNYIPLQNMLAYTRFKSPSFLRRFGGFHNVTHKKKIKHKREIIFLMIKAKILNDLLTNAELEEVINQHLTDIKEAKQHKQVKKQSLKSKSNLKFMFNKTVQTKYVQVDNFEALSVFEQNEIISQNLKTFQKLRNEKSTKAFIKSQGKKQFVVTCDWLSPKEEIILDRVYLTKNQKTNRLEDVLRSLRMDHFTLVDNEREVMGNLDKLPLLVTGTPFFTYLNIMNHPSTVNIQVNSKVGACSDRHYLAVDSSQEMQTQSQIRRQFGLHGNAIDFTKGTISTEKSKCILKLTKRTGTLECGYFHWESDQDFG
jgi:hypothetical protein